MVQMATICCNRPVKTSNLQLASSAYQTYMRDFHFVSVSNRKDHFSLDYNELTSGHSLRFVNISTVLSNICAVKKLTGLHWCVLSHLIQNKMDFRRVTLVCAGCQLQIDTTERTIAPNCGDLYHIGCLQRYALLG